MSVVTPEVLVIGAGPAGSTAAACLARDHEVVLVEEHPRPGSPVQCAGLVTPRGVPPSASHTVLNKVRGAKIHSPMGYVLTLEAKDTRAYVIDRARFDMSLFQKAVDEGVSAMPGSKVVSVAQDDGAVTTSFESGGVRRDVSSSVAIGCDGYRSAARKAAGLPPAKHMLMGIQVDLAGAESDPDFVELYLGENVAPGFFGWAIPAGDTTRVGLCTWNADHAPAVYLKRLLSRPEFSKARKVSSSSGMIPIGPGRTARSGRILLAGDAACHAKPLSGGGVYTGIRGAELSAECVHAFLVTGEEAALEDYDPLWKEAFGKELAKAFRLRKIFVSLSDKKMDKALRIFSDPSLLALLEEKGDIDYPASLSTQVLKLAPKLAQFSPQLIESLLK